MLHINVVLLSVLFGIKGQAQQIVFRNIKTYTQRQGLSSPNIHKIVQDKFGYLWIATQDGLNRFNGREFITYNKDLNTKRRLLAKDIREVIIPPGQDLLWTVGNADGINAVDLVTGDVRYACPYSNLDLRRSWRICATWYQDKLYIGTSGGLEIFNTRTRRFEPPPPALAAFFRTSETSEIWTIGVDPNGICWMGLSKFGLLLFDMQKQQVVREIKAATFLPSPTGNDFWPKSTAFAGDNTCWLGSAQGLFRIRYDRHYRTWVLAADKQAGLPAMTTTEQVFACSNSELLLGGAALHKYNPRNQTVNTIEPADQQYTAWLRNTTYIFEDRQRNYWLGCKQGLAVIGNEATPFIPVRNGEQYQNKLGHLFAVQPLDNDRMLAGTEEGLFLVQPNSIHPLYLQGRVQNIFPLTPAHILISGKAGIRLFTGNRVTAIGQHLPEFKPYVNWQFNSIGYLNDSIALIGTESNAGVLLWNLRTHTLTHLQASKTARPGSLASNNINTIYVNRQHQAILLSDYSISVFHPSDTSFETILYRDSITRQPLGVFMEMTETGSHYWINAYGEGLLQLDKEFKLQKKYGSKAGLTNTGLYELFNHKDSLLILTSNFGISVFHTATGHIDPYFQEDGLQDNAFEEASGATLNGQFYAGGVNGWVKINPAGFIPRITVPELYFTRITMQKTNDAIVDTTNLQADKFVIGNNVLQTTVYFNGLDYKNPDRVNYAYKIPEIKDEWVQLGAQNSVQLMGLSPGTYHLQVKAFTNEGYWSAPRQLVLQFLPRWYQTWWLRLLVSLTLALLIYLAYRYRLRQLQKRHEIRKGIAADLHDNLGSSLNSIKIFANLALNNIQREANLQQIVKSMEQATTELRDMLWVLDDSLDTVDELVTRLNQWAAPVSAAVHIDTHIKTTFETGKRRLTKKEKSNLLLICKEAINNSIKYAGASAIHVDITSRGPHLHLLITDNGTGFDIDAVKKGYGLQNIHYRARQIRYKVDLRAAEGQGTRISIEQNGIR